MGVVLGAEHGIINSVPDYEEAMALTRRLREQRILSDRPARARAVLDGRTDRKPDVLAQGLGWGIGLGLGFWLILALVFRQLF